MFGSIDIADHGNLNGLGDDDHPHYAPVAHVTDTANPHSVTAVQAGADPTGAAAAALVTALAADGVQDTAIGLNTTHRGVTTGNPHSVTATDVGLGNVDDTSDVNKPVSTAQQTEIDTKVDKAGDTMTGRLLINTNSVTDSTGFVGTATYDSVKPAYGSSAFQFTMWQKDLQPSSSFPFTAMKLLAKHQDLDSSGGGSIGNMVALDNRIEIYGGNPDAVTTANATCCLNSAVIGEYFDKPGSVVTTWTGTKTSLTHTYGSLHTVTNAYNNWSVAPQRASGSANVTNFSHLYCDAVPTWVTNCSGITLDGDNAGSDILFGADQDASIYWDGTNFVIDPTLVSAGAVDVKGKLIAVDVESTNMPTVGGVALDTSWAAADAVVTTAFQDADVIVAAAAVAADSVVTSAFQAADALLVPYTGATDDIDLTESATEAVTNGTFDADTDWTKSGFTISGGDASCGPGQGTYTLVSTATVPVSGMYYISFDYSYSGAAYVSIEAEYGGEYLTIENSLTGTGSATFTGGFYAVAGTTGMDFEVICPGFVGALTDFTIDNVTATYGGKNIEYTSVSNTVYGNGFIKADNFVLKSPTFKYDGTYGTVAPTDPLVDTVGTAANPWAKGYIDIVYGTFLRHPTTSQSYLSIGTNGCQMASATGNITQHAGKVSIGNDNYIIQYGGATDYLCHTWYDSTTKNYTIDPQAGNIATGQVEILGDMKLDVLTAVDVESTNMPTVGGVALDTSWAAADAVVTTAFQDADVIVAAAAVAADVVVTSAFQAADAIQDTEIGTKVDRDGDTMTGELEVQETLWSSGTTGGIPTSGAGTRMMWIPSFGAWRGGAVTGTAWDSGNIGVNSFAFGNDPTASGLNGIAMGAVALASGSNSIAMGQNSSGTGIGSTAIGMIAGATGFGSLGLGYSSNATGTINSAIGGLNNITGTPINTAAIGVSNAISAGITSAAIGCGNNVSNSTAAAVGISNTVSAINSAAVGIYNTASGVGAAAMGVYTTSTASGAITIGSGVNTTTKLANATTNTVALGANSTIPTLVLTDSGGVGGIGITQVKGELEVDGDLNHDGNNVGFYNTAPVAQPAALTAAVVTAANFTHIAPGTPDYLIQDLVDSSAGACFGFATKDEGNSVLSVIDNLVLRVEELEAALAAATGVGLIA